MIAATFGTFLTTFAVTINNHGPAAVCVILSLYPAIRIWYDGQRARKYFAMAGFFASSAATFELPALSYFSLLALILLIQSPRNTATAFLPAALVVAAAALATNYIAHGSFDVPYMHGWTTDSDEDWYNYSYQMPDGTTLDSYWKSPGGFDTGEPLAAAYALHVTIGHHGILSLTPIWALSVIGIVRWLRHPLYRPFACVIVVVSLACLDFYLSLPQTGRSYGGFTSGFRWMFWLAPLWLLPILAAVDWIAVWRYGRVAALVVLIMSVISVSYPVSNPWTSPWLWNLFVYLGLA